MSTSNNKQDQFSDYIYVRVNRDQEFGFWEIDLNKQKALFRENSHMRQPANAEIIDYSKLYNTVSSYLQSPDFYMNKNRDDHVFCKVIIKNRKTRYSNDPFCDWYKAGVDAHDPNTMLICDKNAIIIDHLGNRLCSKHANEKFKSKFLNQQD